MWEILLILFLAGRCGQVGKASHLPFMCVCRWHRFQSTAQLYEDDHPFFTLLWLWRLAGVSSEVGGVCFLLGKQ